MYMKLRECVALAALLAATACVDKEFQLDNVSTEVTIGGDVTTLPLGYLENQRLGDIISLDDIEGLMLDQNGNYALAYNGEGDEITIDGVETEFNIEKTVTTFSTEYPSFGITGAVHTISRPFYILPDFGSLKIPANVAVTVPAGHTVSAEEEGKVSESLKYEVPEYLSAVKRIYLKPQSAGDKGAAVNMVLALNDLAAINGGGHVTLELTANDGYELYDKNGNKLKAVKHDENTTTYKIADAHAIAAGAEELAFTVYIASIANESLVRNGVLEIPLEFGYHVSFDITSRQNTLTFNEQPELHMNAKLQYQDADIVLNKVVLLEYGSLADNSTSITIDDLPEEVKSVKKVSFSDHSPIYLLAEGLSWLEDVTAEHIVIEARLPEYLTLHDSKQSGYDASTHTLRTNLMNLRNKIQFNLDALSFDGGGLSPQNGSLTLDFTPDIEAYIEEGTESKLSKILHDREIEFSAGFDKTTLELVSLEGQVAYQYNERTTIDMGGVEEDIDISINNAGMMPVITLNVENPLTLDARVSALLTPVIDGEAKSENSIAINDVEIKAATMKDGAIQNSQTTLILADESLREEYDNPQYTFVSCDLNKLLTGNIPDKVQLDVKFSTDADVDHTIYVTDSYTVRYNYDVNIPLTFNSNLDITIEETASDLADTFDDVADMDVKVGDVTLIADVVNTIPLDFEFDAELLDVNGNPASATLDIPKTNNTLKGSADGRSEAKSTIRIGLRLGKDGSINQLADVDAIRLKLKAKRSEHGGASLNAEQYISVKLKLEIRGKITADLDNI